MINATKNFQRLIFSLILFATITPLQGCVDVAVTGAQATYSRHTLTSTLHDQYLTMQVDRALHWYTEEFKDCNISVSTLNNVVVVVGQVTSQKLHDDINGIVKRVPEVDEFYNLTTINGPVSAMTQMSDSWITTKIKSQLIAENEIDPSQIKVITEDGTVYLIGIITPEQAEIAADLARNTDGVQKVVKIFSYIHISKSVK